MSIFEVLFAPGRRHVEEEKNRLEWTRDEEGDGTPHRGPIDLDSGHVVIRTPDEDRDQPDPGAGAHRTPAPGAPGHIGA